MQRKLVVNPEVMTRNNFWKWSSWIERLEMVNLGVYTLH